MLNKFTNRHKKKYRLNIFILSIAFILGVIPFYFIYYKLRNKAEIYVSTFSSPTKGALPYWIADAVEVGDKDISFLGDESAVVIDKESYEGGGHGRYLSLLLKMTVTRDARRGVYLYRSRPLLVGDWLDLQMTKSRQRGTITYIGTSPPQFEYKKFILTVLGRKVDPEFAENTLVGSTMVNNKGIVLAKVLDKKVTLAEVRVDTDKGQAVVSYDRTKRDIVLTVEVLVKKVSDTYYFLEYMKIKRDEDIDLFLKESSLWGLRILSIKEVPENTSK